MRFFPIVIAALIPCSGLLAQNYTISTFAGNGTAGFGGDNGSATSSLLNLPAGVAVDGAGSVYIADSQNHRVRRVSNGVITTVAGTGSQGFAGDNGVATSAQLCSPGAVAVDAAGNLYIADLCNRRIRKVSNGVITTIAGSGTHGLGGDNGPAASAQLTFTQHLAVDSVGGLYISEFDPAVTGSHRVRKVANGMITTVAGNGTLGFSGEDGPATSAQLNRPNGVAVDAGGNLYIADNGNHRVRKVSSGVITTVAGTGTAGFNGDNGSAATAQLYLPGGIGFDSTGNLYIADQSNNRVRKVANGVITTVGGSGTRGFGGDNGPAVSAQFNFPADVAVDSSGKVYVVDLNNNRIRLLTPPVSPCTFSLSPDSLQAISAGGNFSVSIQTTSNCAWTITGLPSWISVSGANSGVGPATVTLAVSPNTLNVGLTASISIAGVGFKVTQASSQPGAPSITSAGVTNAASFQTGIAPGGIVTIFGQNLGAAPGQVVSAPGAPWLGQLANTRVTMNGLSAPVFRLLNLSGQEQLSVQAPWTLSGANSAAVIVSTASGNAASVIVPVLGAQPGIFILDAAASGATHADGSLVTSAKPSTRGEVVILYLTGLGPVTNQPTNGASASLTALSPTLLVPQLLVGGFNAPVAFAGLAPGYIGLYQINATVPQVVASGLVDLSVQLNGVTSNTAKLAVQ